MAVVTIIVTGRDARVYSSYSERRVEAIKSLAIRKWDPDNKHWIIPADLVGSLTGKLKAIGDTVTVERPAPPPSDRSAALEAEIRRLRGQLHQAQSATSARASSWAELLLDQCDEMLRRKVVTALSKVLHPDVGGDSALQRDLNLARESSRR